jgi:hypothetical protein
VQVPQLTVGQPLPGLKVPHVSVVGHVVGQVLTHVPVELHAWFAPQVPQVTVPPQPSGAVPHTALPQA